VGWIWKIGLLSEVVGMVPEEFQGREAKYKQRLKIQNST